MNLPPSIRPLPFTANSTSTDLADLRRQVLELQQALAKQTQDCGVTEDSTQRKQAELTQRDVQETLEAQVRERTAELENTIRELQTEVERRVLAESALKASEQRYQSLYEQNPFMYFTLTPDGTVLSVNHFGADQLGHRKEDLVGRSILQVFDARDQQTVLEQLIACTASPYTGFQWDIQKIRKDGTRLWVRERARAIHNETGQILVLVVCEDITERKQTEEALRKSEERFEVAFRSSPYPVIMTERDSGRCLEVNEAALKLFGYSRGEVIGETTLALGLWPSLDDRRRFFQPLESTGAIRNRELQLYTKDRKVLTLLASSEVIELNGVSCLITVGNNVTEHKLAEEALRMSELRLQRFVAEAPVGLYILDQSWRAISANRALCELTGYEEHEIVGSTYALYTHPEDLAANIVLTDEFFRGVRSDYTYEKRYVRKTGEIIWVSVKATKVDLSGYNGPLLLAAVQDITERKLAMDEREQLSRDLHDNILQALYAIGMQLEAGKLVIGKSPRRSKTHLAHAVDQLNHLMHDVRRFITLLIQRTTSELDFEHALRQLIISMSGARQTSPELDISPPVLSFITPKIGEQLLNIVREALSNSLRHAHASQRWVRLRLTENTIHLVIGDNGIGFSMKRKRRPGHGLENMAARAKQIDATFTLKSAPGQGTSLVVVLPLQKEQIYD